MQIEVLEINKILELQQIEIGLNVTDAENVIVLQMNVLMQLQMIQMVMNQIVGHCD